MKTGFLCSEYPPQGGGGVGTFTRALGRQLARQGLAVTVVGLYACPADVLEEDEGVRVWRLRKDGVPGTRFLLNGRNLRKKLRELRDTQGLELVEGQENAFAAVGPIRGLKKVIRMHGGHHFFAVTLGKKPALWRGWQEKRSFACADAICAVSRYVAETTRELLGLGDQPIEILPNFVDTDRFFPRPDVREEEGLLVYAGTLCEKKGVRFLLEAMPAILAEFPMARLVVAGRDQYEAAVGGSYREYLLARMNDAVRRSVVFAGAVPHDEMPALLARASVCIYPSLMEAMPMAWLEGMAMGKPVVASRLGPGPEVIEHGVDGLLCDPRQPEELASQVVSLLRNPDLRVRLGRKAWEKVRQSFSPEVMVPQNIRFYRKVLGLS